MASNQNPDGTQPVQLYSLNSLPEPPANFEINAIPDKKLINSWRVHEWRALVKYHGLGYDNLPPPDATRQYCLDTIKRIFYSKSQGQMNIQLYATGAVGPGVIPAQTRQQHNIPNHYLPEEKAWELLQPAVHLRTPGAKKPKSVRGLIHENANIQDWFHADLPPLAPTMSTASSQTQITVRNTSTQTQPSPRAHGETRDISSQTDQPICAVSSITSIDIAPSGSQPAWQPVWAQGHLIEIPETQETGRSDTEPSLPTPTRDWTPIFNRSRINPMPGRNVNASASDLSLSWTEEQSQTLSPRFLPPFSNQASTNSQQSETERAQSTLQGGPFPILQGSQGSNTLRPLGKVQRENSAVSGGVSRDIPSAQHRLTTPTRLSPPIPSNSQGTQSATKAQISKTILDVLNPTGIPFTPLSRNTTPSTSSEGQGLNYDRPEEGIPEVEIFHHTTETNTTPTSTERSRSPSQVSVMPETALPRGPRVSQSQAGASMFDHAIFNRQSESPLSRGSSPFGSIMSAPQGKSQGLSEFPESVAERPIGVSIIPRSPPHTLLGAMSSSQVPQVLVPNSQETPSQSNKRRRNSDDLEDEQNHKRPRLT